MHLTNYTTKQLSECRVLGTIIACSYSVHSRECLLHNYINVYASSCSEWCTTTPSLHTTLQGNLGRTHFQQLTGKGVLHIPEPSTYPCYQTFCAKGTWGVCITTSTNSLLHCTHNTMDVRQELRMYVDTDLNYASIIILYNIIVIFVWQLMHPTQTCRCQMPSVQQCIYLMTVFGLKHCTKCLIISALQETNLSLYH